MQLNLIIVNMIYKRANNHVTSFYHTDHKPVYKKSKFQIHIINQFLQSISHAQDDRWFPFYPLFDNFKGRKIITIMSEITFGQYNNLWECNIQRGLSKF